jgi:hypothetical protein
VKISRGSQLALITEGIERGRFHVFKLALCGFKVDSQAGHSIASA